MRTANCAYITRNWFKQVFLQLYLDYRRGRVFAEAKRCNEWKCPDDLMTFEENCYLTNDEIVSSFSLILKEERLYGLIDEKEAERVLDELKSVLEKDSRRDYLQLLESTEEYRGNDSGVFFFSDDLRYLCWKAEDGDSFYKAFRAMITRIQNGAEFVNRPQTLADNFGFFLFLNLLATNNLRMDIPYRSHPLPGIGRSHTHLSLTDPGRGHRQATVMKRESFESNYVHVEHLERLGRTRREIESYRVPNILDFALVRACVGDLAPVTAYLGRPLCEYSGAFDLLKASNLASAAATAFFAMGAAEIKLAIDPLTISQALAYLERLMTLRSHPRQALSVAFNLNRPYTDDRIPGQTKTVSNKHDIGMLGIDVATSAGWDKITWDGAGDFYPSVCVMEQISFQDALTLVHSAHEKGLTTYFSGGFVIGKGHIATAVYTGVDGIGIGGAQVLRLIDRMGHEGPFLEQNLAKINRERDEAETTIRGRAARLLACLDRLHFEGSLLAELEPVRQMLFDDMKRTDETALAETLEFTKSLNLPIGGDAPEHDYELLVCKRIVDNGTRGIAYLNGSRQEQARTDRALAELRERITEADDIPVSERRIYYADAIRQYHRDVSWPIGATPLRAKFFHFTQRALPKEMALERAS